MKNTVTRVTCLLVVVFATSLGVHAQAIESSEFGVTGTHNADGTFRLDIVPGDFDTNAILVLSQPSKTLLTAVVDSTYLTTQKGQALDANLQSSKSYVTGDLSQITPVVLLAQGPPTTDENIQVLVYGTFEGKKLDGLEVINSRVSTSSSSPTSFGIFARLHLNFPGGDLGISTCCKCGTPSVSCGCVDDCSTPFCNCVDCEMTCD